MTLRELVNQKLPLHRLMSLCGYVPDRVGFMLCPFHEDNRPSFKVYGGDRGFYCFQCHHGGMAVEFFAYLKKISFDYSARYLAEKFKISFTSIQVDIKSPEEKKKQIANARKHIFYGWQRAICFKFFHQLERVSAKRKELVYRIWWNTGIPRLDRVFYNYVIFGRQEELDKFWQWFVDYSKFVQKVTLEHEKEEFSFQGDKEYG